MIRSTLMLKVNMGCGRRDFGTNWIHIDGGNYSHLDYSSLTNLEQFENNSVDLIYSSHVIEYFDREEVNTLLEEWRRVIKFGGILRLAVPNFEVLANMYTHGKIELPQVLGPLFGKMYMDGQKIYHKTTYDFDSLKEVLTNLGFNDIMHYDFRDVEHGNFDDHSQAFIPHMDKEQGQLISLNVECKK